MNDYVKKIEAQNEVLRDQLEIDAALRYEVRFYQELAEVVTTALTSRIMVLFEDTKKEFLDMSYEEKVVKLKEKVVDELEDVALGANPSISYAVALSILCDQGHKCDAGSAAIGSV